MAPIRIYYQLIYNINHKKCHSNLTTSFVAKVTYSIETTKVEVITTI